MDQIKTKRLLLSEAKQSDLPAFEEIEKECDDYFKFDPPRTAEHNRPLHECLSLGEMIPGVSRENYKRENYHLYYVRRDGILIGWLSFYLEYQQKDAAYLSVVYVKEVYRSCGFGAEIINALTEKLAGAGFKTIKTHCSLRNALALRFWVRNVFDKITEIECTGNLYPDDFGGIGLMKEINPSE